MISAYAREHQHRQLAEARGRARISSRSSMPSPSGSIGDRGSRARSAACAARCAPPRASRTAIARNPALRAHPPDRCGRSGCRRRSGSRSSASLGNPLPHGALPSTLDRRRRRLVRQRREKCLDRRRHRRRLLDRGRVAGARDPHQLRSARSRPRSARPCAGGVATSSSPTITSVGAVIRASSSWIAGAVDHAVDRAPDVVAARHHARRTVRPRRAVRDP